MSASPNVARVLSRQELIRKRARHIQLSLWNNRHKIWNCYGSLTPIDVLQPAAALWQEGFEVVTRESLGEEWEQGIRREVAGLLDRKDRKVYISARPPFYTQNFTLAHELGHAILHPHLDVKHREFPKEGPGFQKDRVEVEADWFASEFLMPEKQVRVEFAKRFGEGKFRLTDATAFALFSTSVEKVLFRCRCQRDLSRMLAESSGYVSGSLPSLANRFSVSPKAMAIRIDELDLIDF